MLFTQEQETCQAWSMSNIHTECKTKMGKNEWSDYRITLPKGFGKCLLHVFVLSANG